MGWRLEGEIPRQTCRLLLVFLPHTSNWDFVIGCLFIRAENIDITIFGKDQFYIFPLTYCYDFFGVVPIKRHQKDNFVAQAASLYDNGAMLWTAMAPEGTRSRMDQLKSGYYYFAKKADIPIAVVGPDFVSKTLTITSPRKVMATFEEDAQRLTDFSKTMRAKRPDRSITR